MPKKRSKYDEYFIRKEDAAVCRMCNLSMSWNYKNGTNGMRQHLAKSHEEVMQKLFPDGLGTKRGILDPLYKVRFQEQEDTENNSLLSESLDNNDSTDPVSPTESVLNSFENENSPETENSFENEPSPPLQNRRWAVMGNPTTEIDNVIISMICQDELPVRMLESRGFSDFVRMVAPNFSLQSKEHYIQKTLPMLVTNIEEKIHSELYTVDKLTIGIDIFSPENSPYQVFVVHVYYTNTSTLTLKEILVDYRVYPKEPVSLDFLMSRLPKVLDMETRTVKIMYHQKYCEESTLKETKMLPSFNELLNEIIYESFDTALIRKQRNILLECLRFGDSYGVSIESSESGLTKDILQSVKNLSWEQLSEVVELLLDAMERYRLLGDDHFNESIFNLTDEEHDVSQLMSEVLKDFHEPTSSITHRFYPTASIIIPSLRVLGYHLEDFCAKYQSDATKSCLSKLQEVVESKYVTCQNNMTLKTATFLDPRFKGRFFTEPHGEYIKNKYGRATRSTGSPKELMRAVDSPFFSFLTRPQMSSATPQRRNFEVQLDEYQSGEIDRDQDPCEYWKSNQSRFSILKSVAMEFLSIPASATRAKELYETGQNICPLTEESLIDNQNLVYCYANLEEYANF